jgi:predicted RNase H-like HicB family nuclease
MVNFTKVKGGYVAQCPDNPQFIVEANSKGEIPEKMETLIKGYVEAFPQEKSVILPNGANNLEIKLRSTYIVT